MDCYTRWIIQLNFPWWQDDPLSPVVRLLTFYLFCTQSLTLASFSMRLAIYSPPYFSFSPALFPHLQLLWLLQFASTCGSNPFPSLVQKRVGLTIGQGVYSLSQTIYSSIEGLVGDIALVGLDFTLVPPQLLLIIVLFLLMCSAFLQPLCFFLQKYCAFLQHCIFLLYLDGMFRYFGPLGDWIILWGSVCFPLVLMEVISLDLL